MCVQTHNNKVTEAESSWIDSLAQNAIKDPNYFIFLNWSTQCGSNITPGPRITMQDKMDGMVIF